LYIGKTMTIKPIETFYKGYRFRSRLEARWAVFFDALNIKWKYEYEGYILEDGTKYLPDFLINDEIYAEVKPFELLPEERHKVELFGKEYPIILLIGEPQLIRYEIIAPPFSKPLDKIKKNEITKREKNVERANEEIRQKEEQYEKELNVIKKQIKHWKEEIKKIEEINDLKFTFGDMEYTSPVSFATGISIFQYTHDKNTWWESRFFDSEYVGELLGSDALEIEKACSAAKSARFEFGENS
jgi:hypothetical protein